MTVAAQFNIPVSTQAFQEYSSLMLNLEHVTLSHTETDIWTYNWGNHKYSSSKFYYYIFQSIQVADHSNGFGKADRVSKLN